MARLCGGEAALVASPIPGYPAIAIFVEQGALSALRYLDEEVTATLPREPLAQQAAAWLSKYLDDARSPIPPIQPLHGTPFQRRVWQRLQQIPPGEVLRYGELAKVLDSGARAVAAACRANPLPILIPCHRVVSHKGLGGYMGQVEGKEVAIKQWLLHHEGYV